MTAPTPCRRAGRGLLGGSRSPRSLSSQRSRPVPGRRRLRGWTLPTAQREGRSAPVSEGAQGLSPSELTRCLPMLEAHVHTCVRSRVWEGGSCVHVCVCVRFLGPMHPGSSHFLAGGLREEPQVQGWGASHRQSSAGRPLTHSHPHARSRPFSGEQSSILRFQSGFWRQFWGPRPGPQRLALWDGQPKVLRRSPIPSSHCTEEETEVPRPQGRAPGDRASPELRWSGPLTTRHHIHPLIPQPLTGLVAGSTASAGPAAPSPGGPMPEGPQAAPTQLRGAGEEASLLRPF